jgi:NodT family efflux transporter outer membrane factor (OMF) lipoprotein
MNFYPEKPDSREVSRALGCRCRGWVREPAPLVRLALLVSTLMASLSLPGCAVGPDFVRPKPPVATQYTQGKEPAITPEAEGLAQQFQTAGKIAADWWRLFGNAELDKVVQMAIAGNQNLQVAQAHLRASQETLKASYGIFFPLVDGGLDASRQKYSAARVGGSSSSLFSLFTASATVSYTLDVFGGSRRAVEGQQAQVDYQRYEVLATTFTLLGNVFNAVVAQASYRAQAEATEQIIGVVREQVRVVEAQANAGMVPYANVLSIQTQLATFEANLPSLRQNLNRAQHLLATLVGLAPSEWTPPVINLGDLTLPCELPVSLPSELVRQRPDILSAEAQLHAASANVGVATAALFPSLTLNGGFGQNSTDMAQFLDKAGNFWSLAASLSATVFDAGTRWFQRRAAIGAYEAALATYKNTILTAFAQVADVLRALEHDAETLKAQSRSVDTAFQALHLIQTNFEAGTANYLQVLVANTQYHQARLGYIQAQAQRFQDTAALFVALGGGWWNAAEPNKRD